MTAFDLPISSLPPTNAIQNRDLWPIARSGSNFGVSSQQLFTYISRKQLGKTVIVVEAGTSAALPSCVYANGTAGVGATLTASANGAFSAISFGGISINAINQLVLVKNQANQVHNGVYKVTNLGSPSTKWVLTRDVTSDSTVELNDQLVSVQEGTQEGLWSQTSTSPTVGTTVIIYTITKSANNVVYVTQAQFISLVNNSLLEFPRVYALIDMGMGGYLYIYTVSADSYESEGCWQMRLADYANYQQFIPGLTTAVGETWIYNGRTWLCDHAGSDTVNPDTPLNDQWALLPRTDSTYKTVNIEVSLNQQLGNGDGQLIITSFWDSTLKNRVEIVYSELITYNAELLGILGNVNITESLISNLDSADQMLNYPGTMSNCIIRNCDFTVAQGVAPKTTSLTNVSLTDSQVTIVAGDYNLSNATVKNCTNIIFDLGTAGYGNTNDVSIVNSSDVVLAGSNTISLHHLRGGSIEISVSRNISIMNSTTNSSVISGSEDISISNSNLQDSFIIGCIGVNVLSCTSLSIEQCNHVTLDNCSDGVLVQVDDSYFSRQHSTMGITLGANITWVGTSYTQSLVYSAIVFTVGVAKILTGSFLPNGFIPHVCSAYVGYSVSTVSIKIGNASLNTFELMDVSGVSVNMPISSIPNYPYNPPQSYQSDGGQVHAKITTTVFPGAPVDLSITITGTTLL